MQLLYYYTTTLVYYYMTILLHWPLMWWSCGMECCGVLWCGVRWCGVVWSGHTTKWCGVSCGLVWRYILCAQLHALTKLTRGTHVYTPHGPNYKGKLLHQTNTGIA